jgi:GNAT superfamily N-acetyltransferase
MQVTIHPAEPSDVPTLVDLYDRAYHGGYSACFDRYGPASPQDFWWVQSEKPVYLVEIDRKPSGLIIVGRMGRQLLVEEVVVHPPAAGRDADGQAKVEEGVLKSVHDFLVKRFHEERQDLLTVRCVETNAMVLNMVRRHDFTFANALVVATGAARREARVPEGYSVRRAAAADARPVARLQEETLHVPVRPDDLDALWKQGETRVFLAEREKFPVGLGMAQVKDGVGRWTVGVREGHRGKGIGTVLAQEVLQSFHTKHLTPVTTYWALDPSAAGFVRSLDVHTERTYLYFEKRL